MTDRTTPPDTHGMPPSSDAPLSLSAVTDLCTEIEANVSRVIVGHEEAIEHVITAILGRGHILLEDVPGVGKTMLARSIATSIDCTFRRVQFTPDLLPTDVTGVNVFNQKTREFEFNKGPVFANIVLGDEINRAPPKTQAALLEAMEEQQVTVDGETHQLEDPFTVIATQNTVEGDQAYDLPLAEVDRFMKKISLGYPDPVDEVEMLDRVVGHHPIEELSPVATLDEFRAARLATADITVSRDIREYATRLSNYTREHTHLGVSPRGTIALLRAGQARALLAGREYVVPDDVQREAQSVLAHRIRTGGSEDSAEIVAAALDTVDPE